jgi:TonB-dependent receptor
MSIKTTPNKLHLAMRAARFRPVAAGVLCGTTLLCAMPTIAQENTQPEEPQTEVIEVRGVRQTIQSAIAIKRESVEVVDGLSANDIGDLPALSIGEALETITGAASHREQGGATEISLRGLGPFLSSTVFNGREATNGSGDRSVNFSQFPSELIQKAAIYKTQAAEYIEGGVAGQIHLDTLKPLDFGKRRVQVQVKGNFNPDNNALDLQRQGIGSRTTVSFVDQFESDSVGEIGVSVGFQRDDRTNPEQEARTGTSQFLCPIDPNGGIGQFRTDCDQQLDGVDPNAPFLFSRGANSFRQNITDDKRESLFGAIQWRPNDKFELNLDFQSSDRDFSEFRNDLTFTEIEHLDAFGTNPNAIRDENGDRIPLLVGEGGQLLQATVLTNIETLSSFAERIEEYDGGGLGFTYNINDSLTLSADLSYSNTDRVENIIQTRLQSENDDINGLDVPGADNNGEVQIVQRVFDNGSLIPTYTLRNFDVNDHDAFADEARTRLDLNQLRNHTITAFRTDAVYIPNIDYIKGFKTGFRYSLQEFDTIPRERNEFTFADGDILQASLQCRNNGFPEPDFFDNESGGAPLFTNIDENGNVLEAGTGNTFATFDPICLANNLLGNLSDDNGNPLNIDNSFPVLTDELRQNVDSVDVEEETLAFYLQADYDTFIGDYAVRGNLGVRVVHTSVDSASFRAPLIVDATRDVDPETGEETLSFNNVLPNPDAPIERVSGQSSYTEFLPSFNLVVDASDEVLVRGAVYRTLSRPDPIEFGFGRTFQGLSNDDEIQSIDELVSTVVASGNPSLDPLTAWNFDTSVEWYANDDTLLSLGLYYKSFQGGFENVVQNETFTIEGIRVDGAVDLLEDGPQVINADVAVSQVADDTSTIFGAEVTATHSFSYLDNFLKGFGFKFSYNYANSNFEFEDADFGDRIEDGELVEGVIPPANLFGFSEHTLFGQLYYQWEDLNVSINYKFRSHYFQQFTNPNNVIRFVDDTEVWEARVSYRLNRNWKFSVEAINLFDEPRRDFRPTRGNLSQVLVYGPRIFAGVTYRL